LVEICDNGNVFETESVHSGMILLQNRSPGRISSAQVDKPMPKGRFLGKVTSKIQIYLH